MTRIVLVSVMLMAALSAVGCAAWIPTPEQPCQGLYCATWKVYGANLRVCADTKAELDRQGAALEARGGVRVTQ